MASKIYFLKKYNIFVLLAILYFEALCDRVAETCEKISTRVLETQKQGSEGNLPLVRRLAYLARIFRHRISARRALSADFLFYHAVPSKPHIFFCVHRRDASYRSWLLAHVVWWLTSGETLWTVNYFRNRVQRLEGGLASYLGLFRAGARQKQDEQEQTHPPSPSSPRVTALAKSPIFLRQPRTRSHWVDINVINRCAGTGRWCKISSRLPFVHAFIEIRLATSGLCTPGFEFARETERKHPRGIREFSRGGEHFRTRSQASRVRHSSR